MNNRQIIGQAIVFIENHLYEPITARDVATAVSYSYHHFHRYFSAVMGETIGSYIRSRRLTQAAWDLTHTQKKIIEIGLSLYFETPEGFTRAFKDRYSITPTEYRKNGIDVLIGNRQSAQMPDQTVLTYGGLSPEIITVREIPMIGIRFNATINGKETMAMWQKFHAQLPHDLLFNKKYGVFEAAETCTLQRFHADCESTAFIGVEAPKNYPVPETMLAKKLMGGKYAVFTHKGIVDSLIQTYQYIWGVWFPKSGFELANRDDFECYTQRFAGADNEKSEIDIYFPIN